MSPQGDKLVKLLDELSGQARVQYLDPVSREVMFEVKGPRAWPLRDHVEVLIRVTDRAGNVTELMPELRADS